MTPQTRLFAVVVLAGAAMGSMVPWRRARRRRPRASRLRRRRRHPPPQPQPQTPPADPGATGRPRGRRRRGPPGRRRPSRRLHAVHPPARVAGRAGARQGALRHQLRQLPRAGPARRRRRQEAEPAALGHGAAGPEGRTDRRRDRQAQPDVDLVEADTVAVAEYIHSIHATMGGQGSPPGRNPTNVTLNVLVGDAKAGEATFARHVRVVPLGDRQPQRDRREVPDPRALQNAWVCGSGGTFGGGGRAAAAARAIPRP